MSAESWEEHFSEAENLMRRAAPCLHNGTRTEKETTWDDGRTISFGRSYYTICDICGYVIGVTMP